MKNYKVKFTREYELVMVGSTIKEIEAQVLTALAKLPEGTAKLLSIIAEDCLDMVDEILPLTETKLLERNAGLAKKVHDLLPGEPPPDMLA